MEKPRTRLMAGRLTAVLALLAAGAGQAAAGTPPPTNQLQNVPVFQDRLFGTWSGGDIVAPGSFIPIDTAQMYGGLPSLRFEVVGPSNWWWLTILAGQDWMPYSVEHYRASGFLEFNVKGAVGGEMFTLAVGDLDNARTPLETTLDSVGSWNFVTVTTEWQHVRVPLSALMPEDQVVPLGTFEPRLAQLVDLKFFCGFSFGEIAELQGISERTAQRDWDKARILLQRHIRGQHATPSEDAGDQG